MRCRTCGGDGIVVHLDKDEECPTCDGTGTVNSHAADSGEQCENCGCFPLQGIAIGSMCEATIRVPTMTRTPCVCHRYGDTPTSTYEVPQEDNRTYKVVLELHGLATDDPRKKFYGRWFDLPGFGIATFVIDATDPKCLPMDSFIVPDSLGGGMIPLYGYLFQVLLETDISVTGTPDEWDWAAMLGIENNNTSPSLRTVEYLSHVELVRDPESGHLLTVLLPEELVPDSEQMEGSNA